MLPAILPALLAIADAWLFLTLLRRRCRRPVLMGYLALVVPVYLIREQLMGLPRAWWQPLFWGPANIAVAAEVCWLALPKGSERRWFVAMAAVIGGAAASVVVFGGSGDLFLPKVAYYLMTPACAFAAAMGGFAALYCWAFYRSGRFPLLVGLYFAVDVAANERFRWVSRDPAAIARLVSMDHVGHLLLVLCAIGLLYAGDPEVTLRNGSRLPSRHRFSRLD